TAADYGQVLDILKDESDAQAVAMRGEARWRNYVKEKTDANAPLVESDKGVQDALADLKTANNATRADEIQRLLRTLDTDKLLAEAEAQVKELTVKVAKAQAKR